MKKDLSKIKKIDLRDIWNHEALDFTKWLAEEENIKLLSDEVGVDIKLIQREANVGRYNVDILAEEESTGHKIIIENQLEDTNHDHLGKLLTYASGHDAKIMIWIVKNAREEHVKAIEWLNDITDDSINFFLINIEVWQIDNSNPAPKFEVLVRPNEWAKTIRSTSGSGELTNTKIQQLNFWGRFKEYSKLNYPHLKLQSPSPNYWMSYTIGSSLANLVLTINTKDDSLGCEILIPNNKEFFEYLKSHKEEVEAKLGRNLEWKEKAKGCKILIKLKSINVLSEDNDQKNFDWFEHQLDLFKKVFVPYVKSFSKETSE